MSNNLRTADAAEHKDGVRALARQILAGDQDWLARHLEQVGASSSQLEMILNSLTDLALDVNFDRDTREGAVRAACRLAEVNQIRISDHLRFNDMLVSPDFEDD